MEPEEGHEEVFLVRRRKQVHNVVMRPAYSSPKATLIRKPFEIFRRMVFQGLTSQYEVGILALRLFFGALLATHGYPKLSARRKATQDWLAGMKLPRVLGLLVGILELFGGVFLVLGFLTPIVAFLFILQFLGILVERRRLGKKSLSDYEMDLMYLGGALALLFLGGGTYSIDYVLGL